MKALKLNILLIGVFLSLISCSNSNSNLSISSRVTSIENIDEKVNELLGRMTLEEKVGQIFMVEIGSITPDQVKEYHIGAILNGGGSFPNKNKNHELIDWVELADDYYLASIDDLDQDNQKTNMNHVPTKQTLAQVFSSRDECYPRSM